MQVERKVKRKREKHVELKRCDSAIHNYFSWNDNFPTHILYKKEYWRDMWMAHPCKKYLFKQTHL